MVLFKSQGVEVRVDGSTIVQAPGLDVFLEDAFKVILDVSVLTFVFRLFRFGSNLVLHFKLPDFTTFARSNLIEQCRPLLEPGK